MRYPSVFLHLAAIAGYLAATDAAGAQELITTADPAVVLEVAKGYGSATLDTDSDGNPMISGRMETVKYSVFFYSCVSGKDCRSIQFSTGYTDPYTIEKANEWNTKYRWIKSYESDHASNFRMDVDFKGGITRAYLDAQFETWNSLIVDIREFVAKQ